MTQFEGLEFRPLTLPFVSSVDKAQEAVRRINHAAEEEGLRPIVFSTLVQDELREIVVAANALFLDLFSTFVGPLERELDTRSTHRAGRAHGMADLAAYTTRITPPTSRSPTTTAAAATTRSPMWCWSEYRGSARLRPACIWRCNTGCSPPTIRSPRTIA